MRSLPITRRLKEQNSAQLYYLNVTVPEVLQWLSCYLALQSALLLAEVKYWTWEKTNNFSLYEKVREKGWTVRQTRAVMRVGGEREEREREGEIGKWNLSLWLFYKLVFVSVWNVIELEEWWLARLPDRRNWENIWGQKNKHKKNPFALIFETYACFAAIRDHCV